MQAELAAKGETGSGGSEMVGVAKEKVEMVGKGETASGGSEEVVEGVRQRQVHCKVCLRTQSDGGGFPMKCVECGGYTCARGCGTWRRSGEKAGRWICIDCIRQMPDGVREEVLRMIEEVDGRLVVTEIRQRLAEYDEDDEHEDDDEDGYGGLVGGNGSVVGEVVESQKERLDCVWCGNEVVDEMDGGYCRVVVDGRRSCDGWGHSDGCEECHECHVISEVDEVRESGML